MHTSGKVFITEIPMNSEWQAAYFSVLSMESNITFIPFGLIPFSFPPSLRRDKTTCNFVLQPVDSINNKMLARKGSYVHKHQTICLFCNGVTTLGKITVTQPTPLSLEVFALCFNEVHLTVLILMHNGIKNVPQSLARHNRLGRCRILPTRL